MLAAALAMDTSAASHASVARAAIWHICLALWARCDLAMDDHDPQVAQLCDRLDDPADRAETLWFLGLAQWGTGDLAAADRVDQALATFRALGHLGGRGGAEHRGQLRPAPLRPDRGPAGTTWRARPADRARSRWRWKVSPAR